MEYYTLSNGITMPKLGFGTYKIPADIATDVVSNAISFGYRHIDTATYYNNEEAIGKAICMCTVPRDELFITTKLWTDVKSYDDAMLSVRMSLCKLGIDYLDLVLIHWPTPNNSEVWRAMEDMYDEGLIRAIGVSNFKIHHIDELLETARITPQVLQVELHPYFQQEMLRKYASEHNIQVEAWSPLLRGSLFFDTTLNELAVRYNKTVAQIALRFLMEEGISIIPKTVHPQYMRENIDIFDFDLLSVDRERLRTLNKNIRYYRDPDRHGF